jgi:peroxiredoxin
MLMPGDRFPDLGVSLPRGKSISLPSDFDDSWAYVMFFRGGWCGYCLRHMALVQEQFRLLNRLGVQVIAASTDSEAVARKTISDNGFTFPIGFGVTEEDISAIGAVQDERQGKPIVQPAEFILKPGGEIAASVYASTQVGRMNPREVAVFVKDRL